MKQELLRHLNSFLDTLETNEGFIKRDIGKISEFQNSMDSFFEKHGIPFMAWMVYAIDRILKDVVSDFEEDGAEYDDVAFMKEIYGVKGDTVQRRRNGQPTVLFALATMAVIRQDVINKMQSAMIGDTTISSFRDAIGKSTSRKFHDFFEVNSVAILFQTHNAASHFFAKEFNYTKFRYEGGLIAESREFCQERDGHEFFIEQGKEWNDLEWKGKIPGVDFFVQCGGFNCRHWVVYLKE